MSADEPIQHGTVKSSYFWDDGSGINGDTGAPASGEPMQKGLAASPSWPLGTEGYVEYNGKKAEFFVGDRGPGDPAQSCDVLLDLDGETFAELTGESWDSASRTVSGGNGHIDVDYYITEWGDGQGSEGAPHPMGNEGNRCEDAVSEVPEDKKQDAQEQSTEQDGSGSGSDPSPEQQQEADELKEKKADLQGKQDETEQKQQELAEKQQANDEDDATTAAGGGESGTQTETAASELSGLELAGNDAPLAAGVLTLALVPILIAAVVFTKWRPALARSSDGAAASDMGRHRKAKMQVGSPLAHLRRLLPKSRE